MSGKRRKVGVFAVLVAAAIVVGLLSMGKSQPRYEGRKLSVWLVELNAEDLDERDRARQAVSATGAEALPALLSYFEYQESEVIVKFNGFLSSMKDGMRIGRPAEDYHWMAFRGMEAMGADGRAAADALREIALRDSLSMKQRFMAATALARLSPEIALEVAAEWKSSEDRIMKGFGVRLRQELEDRRVRGTAAHSEASPLRSSD